VEQLRRELASSREAISRLESRLDDRIEAKLDECLAVTARTDARIDRLFVSLLRSIFPSRLRAAAHARLRHWLWPDSPRSPGKGEYGRAISEVEEARRADPLSPDSACAASLDGNAILARTVQQIEISPAQLERSLYLIAVCRKVSAPRTAPGSGPSASAAQRGVAQAGSLVPGASGAVGRRRRGRRNVECRVFRAEWQRTVRPLGRKECGQNDAPGLGAAT
jgi:hypothetical protein